MRFDPTVPVHRQPSKRVAYGTPKDICTIAHSWAMYGENAVRCSWCHRVLVRLDGRRSYRGSRRRTRRDVPGHVYVRPSGNGEWLIDRRVVDGWVGLGVSWVPSRHGGQQHQEQARISSAAA